MKTSSSLLSQSSSYLQNHCLTLISFSWEYFYAKCEKWREETSLCNMCCVFKKVYSDIYKKLLFYQQQRVDHKEKHSSVMVCDVLQDGFKCVSCIVAQSVPPHKVVQVRGYKMQPAAIYSFDFLLRPGPIAFHALGVYTCDRIHKGILVYHMPVNIAMIHSVVVCSPSI